MLLFVLLIPLLGGVQIFPLPVSVPQEITAVHSSLQELPDNAPVLMVADYSPAVVGEIQAAGSAAVTDLLRKGARVSVISTSPTGLALANQLIREQISSAGQQAAGYSSGEKIAHLGYLPGGASGVAAFISDPKSAAPAYSLDGRSDWDLPVLGGVQGISDFARVIISDRECRNRASLDRAAPAEAGQPIGYTIDCRGTGSPCPASVCQFTAGAWDGRGDYRRRSL